MAQVLTANRLVDGTVVYWRAGQWVEGLSQADVFDNEAAGNAALAEAQSFVADNVVVATYLFDVRVDGGIAPVKEREIIRAAGPSIHADLGKQAEGLTPDSVRRAAAARDVRVKASPARERDNDVSI
jgi:hypothetical protein